MKKTKEEKLNALIPLLAELETLEKRLHAHRIEATAYAPISSLAFGKAKKKALEDRTWRKVLSGARLTRAMKSMGLLFDAEITESVADFSSVVCTAVRRIQPRSKLTPRASKVHDALADVVYFSAMDISTKFANVAEDVFQQGRFHQTLFMRKLASHQKFIEKEDTTPVYVRDCLHNVEASLRFIFDKMKSAFMLAAAKATASREELDLEMQSIVAAHTPELHSIVHAGMLGLYAFGNLYQLNRDGVRNVSWQLSDPLANCRSCRKVQNVVYDFDDIWQRAKKEGPRCFNQSLDCTCAFVARMV